MVITTIAPITLPHRLSPLCINHILGSLEAPPKALERVVVVVVLSLVAEPQNLSRTRASASRLAGLNRISPISHYSFNQSPFHIFPFCVALY